MTKLYGILKNQSLVYTSSDLKEVKARGECCNYCEYMKSIYNKDYCIRFPPVKKNKFPIVDPYYTRCGEFKNKVKQHGEIKI